MAADLRRAGPADAEAVRDLTRLAYARWVPLLGREPTPVKQDYERVVREHPIDLLFAGDELLALVWMIVHPEHLLIESLAVSPAHQGRGHGRRMLAHAESVAADLGLRLTRLYTNRLFVANIELYAVPATLSTARSPFGAGSRCTWPSGSGRKAYSSTTRCSSMLCCAASTIRRLVTASAMLRLRSRSSRMARRNQACSR